MTNLEKQTCPKCKSTDPIMVEYGYLNPNHYDGISELLCKKCKTRWGRWSGKILKDGEWEGKWGEKGKPFPIEKGGEIIKNE